jgi:hippurate hydrolase
MSLPVPLPLRFCSTASSPSCGVVPDINHAGMTAWRRDLHKHPEIGFEEHRTSDVVAALLESFGAEVTRGVATTGLVGTIRGSGGGGGGRSLGLRADMDALPMTEGDTTPGSTSTPPYRSVHEGRFHGCGHDGHTSMLLGAAEYLGRHQSSFSGTVHFIFQPAEENGHGAREMMREGLFERFPCDESETDWGGGVGGGEIARAR